MKTESLPNSGCWRIGWSVAMNTNIFGFFSIILLELHCSEI